jgi:hypothetical protein
MMRRIAAVMFALVLCVAGLSDCAEAPPPPPPSSPPNPPLPSPPSVKTFVVFFDFDKSNLAKEVNANAGVATVFSPTSAHARVRVLYADAWSTIRAPEGFILLVRGHDSRNLAVCRSVVTTFGKPLLGVKSQRNETPLYWPDRRKSNAVAAKSPFECVDRLANFDYDRSDDAISNLKRISLVGDRIVGPILIAFRETNKIAYALDLSELHDDEMQDFLARWHDDLLQDPSLWTGTRLKRELFRQKMRHLLHEASGVVGVLIPLVPTQAWAKDK